MNASVMILAGLSALASLAFLWAFLGWRKADRALGAAQEKAVAGQFENPQDLRTLATALALNGDFERAARMATRGELLARKAGATALADVIAQQVTAFEQGRVYPAGH